MADRRKRLPDQIITVVAWVTGFITFSFTYGPSQYFVKSIGLVHFQGNGLDTCLMFLSLALGVWAGRKVFFQLHGQSHKALVPELPTFFIELLAMLFGFTLLGQFIDHSNMPTVLRSASELALLILALFALPVWGFFRFIVRKKADQEQTLAQMSADGDEE